MMSDLQGASRYIDDVFITVALSQACDGGEKLWYTSIAGLLQCLPNPPGLARARRRLHTHLVYATRRSKRFAAVKKG